MPRYKLKIEYVGTNYSGFQIQPRVKTVAGVLRDAIKNLCGEKVEAITGCGRTDAGVHAMGQVLHVDINKEFDNYSLSEGLNFHLRGEDVSVISSHKVRDDFNARYDSKGKIYEYLIINRKSPSPILKDRAWHVRFGLDINKMRQAAKYLLGTHDFTSFRSADCHAKNPIRTIDEIKISKKSEQIKITVKAESFLYNQVRIIVGTLVEIGSNRIAVEDIEKILKAKSRIKAGPTAPACGLYMAKVFY